MIFFTFYAAKKQVLIYENKIQMAPEAVISHHHQGEQGALAENTASSTITSSDHEGLPGQGEIDLHMVLK